MLDYMDEHRKNAWQNIDAEWRRRIDQSYKHLRVNKYFWPRVYDYIIGPRLSDRPSNDIEIARKRVELQERIEADRRELARLVEISKPAFGNRHDIEQEVIAKHGIGIKSLRGKGRLPDVIAARREMWYRVRVECGLAYTQLSKIYDKDHSTIIHGIREHCKANGLPYPRVKNSSGIAVPSVRAAAFRNLENTNEL